MAGQMFLLVLTAGLAYANPLKSWGPQSSSVYGSSGSDIQADTATSTGYPGCTDFFVNVPVDYQYYKTKFAPFTSQDEATALDVALTSRTPLNASTIVTGPFNGSSYFNISTRYCPATTKDGQHNKTLLLLTHGLGFDKSYWSFDYPAGNPNNYSFTYHANAAGYPTLSYDRLGTGLSPHVDPYNTVQGPVELALLASMTELIRAGTFSKSVPKPSKVVHIGHSWGSQLGNAFAATYPSISDGIVLTGYSNVDNYMRDFQIATGFNVAAYNQPSRFASLSTGYITWGNAAYNQESFLDYPYYNEGVLAQTEATKQPFTIGEFLTGGKLAQYAPAFNKPVLLMAASNDFIFCGANCTHDLIDGPAKQNLPVAKPLNIYIQPNTAHGMNLHYNATGWYNYTFNWLNTNGF